jgi:aminopeptidase N
MKYPLLIFLLIVGKTVQATDPYPRNESIDIRHYQFTVVLSDSTDRISGETTIDIRFRKGVNSFELDLASRQGEKGMEVQSVTSQGQALSFRHQNDRLIISIPQASANEDRQFTIRYAGIPMDGLIIGKNKFGDRTFFGDNWPNRAHHWLPVIDHPYDKATCEFRVTAPEQYSVIATGIKMEESAQANHQKFTHWKTAVALPTKVMVIGVARFAIANEGNVHGVPLESWVYPQNKDAGFYDYSFAAKPLDLFSKIIAPYPYEKLANVQSTTRFGGMENAGNIFYYEKSVSGKASIEGLLAHEIAHQWFGDSASEADWFHVWLSEGFATYLSSVYFENTVGPERLRQEMEQDRKQVLDYFLKNPRPIVDEQITDITKVLNTNTYQKASWVLHMLRQEVGDQKFWVGVRAYYEKFKLGNAVTDDFRQVMEEVSGQNLKSFFDQWLYGPGHPVVAVEWRWVSKEKKIRITVTQKQDKLFQFPLEFGVQGAGGQSVERAVITARKQEITLNADQKPTSLQLDPLVHLLFQGTSKELVK